MSWNINTQIETEIQGSLYKSIDDEMILDLPLFFNNEAYLNVCIDTVLKMMKN